MVRVRRVESVESEVGVRERYALESSSVDRRERNGTGGIASGNAREARRFETSSTEREKAFLEVARSWVGKEGDQPLQFLAVEPALLTAFPKSPVDPEKAASFLPLSATIPLSLRRPSVAEACDDKTGELGELVSGESDGLLVDASTTGTSHPGLAEVDVVEGRRKNALPPPPAAFEGAAMSCIDAEKGMELLVSVASDPPSVLFPRPKKGLLVGLLESGNAPKPSSLVVRVRSRAPKPTAPLARSTR